MMGLPLGFAQPLVLEGDRLVGASQLVVDE